MRAALVVGLLASLCPAAAIAQTAPAAAPSAATPGGGDMTRDEYIERARRNAEKRFDRMDANHDGVLTPDERRAARTRRRSPQAQ